VRFEWDSRKADANLRTHGVSFAEAATVFEDDSALSREDPDAVEEPRFVTLGLSNLSNLLVVVYAYREPDIIRVISAWKASNVRGGNMKKVVAERRRDIDFSRAKRGAVVQPEPGKTKISIRLDNAVIEHFRNLVDKAGGGNYQTLINDALLEHVHRRSTVDIVRQVVREELVSYGTARRSKSALQRTRSSRR
jgi:uncharacterized DUF497 family protein